MIRFAYVLTRDGCIYWPKYHKFEWHDGFESNPATEEYRTVKRRFIKEQILGLLCEAGAGMLSKELCRKHDFSEASYYLWRSKFGGMSVPGARRLKKLDTENTRLKKLLAEQMLENKVFRDVLRKKM